MATAASFKLVSDELWLTAYERLAASYMYLAMDELYQHNYFLRRIREN